MGTDADIAGVVHAGDGCLRAVGMGRGQRTHLEVPAVVELDLARLTGDIADHVAAVAQRVIAAQQHQATGVELGAGVAGLGGFARHLQCDDVVGPGLALTGVIAWTIFDGDAFDQRQVVIGFQGDRLIGRDPHGAVHDAHRQVTVAGEFQAADIGRNDTHVMPAVAQIEITFATQDQFVCGEGRARCLGRTFARVDAQRQPLAGGAVFVGAFRILEHQIAQQVQDAVGDQGQIVLERRAFIVDDDVARLVVANGDLVEAILDIRQVSIGQHQRIVRPGHLWVIAAAQVNIQAIGLLLQGETATTGNARGEIDFVGGQARIALGEQGLADRERIRDKFQVAGLGHAGDRHALWVCRGLAIGNGHNADGQVIDIGKADRAGVAGDRVDVVGGVVQVMNRTVTQQHQAVGDDGAAGGLVDLAAIALQHQDRSRFVVVVTGARCVRYDQLVIDVDIAGTGIEDKVVVDPGRFDDADVTGHVRAADLDRGEPIAQSADVGAGQLQRARGIAGAAAHRNVFARGVGLKGNLAVAGDTAGTAIEVDIVGFDGQVVVGAVEAAVEGDGTALQAFAARGVGLDVVDVQRATDLLAGGLVETARNEHELVRAGLLGRRRAVLPIHRARTVTRFVQDDLVFAGVDVQQIAEDIVGIAARDRFVIETDRFPRRQGDCALADHRRAAHDAAGGGVEAVGIVLGPQQQRRAAVLALASRGDRGEGFVVHVALVARRNARRTTIGWRCRRQRRVIRRDHAIDHGDAGEELGDGGLPPDQAVFEVGVQEL